MRSSAMLKRLQSCCEALGIVAVVAVVSSPATAGIEAIQGANNSAWIAGGGALFDYAEFADGGANIDTERDWLGAFSGGASVLGGESLSFIPTNLYLALEADSAFGNARYNGSLLFSGTPFTGTTKETIWGIHSRVGYSFTMGAAMLIPYVEFGYRLWDREASSTQSVRYRNFDLKAGLLAQYSPSPKFVYSVWGGVGSTFGADATSTNPIGGNPDLEFELGSDLAWNIGAKVGYAVIPQLELFARAGIERLGYGRSQNIRSGAFFFYEPESRTLTATTQLGVAYRF